MAHRSVFHHGGPIVIAIGLEYGADGCLQLSALETVTMFLLHALIPASLTQTASAAQETANRNYDSPAGGKISNFTNYLCFVRKLQFLYLPGKFWFRSFDLFNSKDKKTVILF